MEYKNIELLNYLGSLKERHNIDLKIISNNVDIDYFLETLHFYRHNGNYSCYDIVERKLYVGLYYNDIDAILVDENMTMEDLEYEDEVYLIRKMQEKEIWRLQETHKRQLEELEAYKDFKDFGEYYL